MSNPGIKASAKYRAKQKARTAAMEVALHSIIAELGDKPGPVATKCREIASAALNPALTRVGAGL